MGLWQKLLAKNFWQKTSGKKKPRETRGFSETKT
jgi:hypothetical protein